MQAEYTPLDLGSSLPLGKAGNSAPLKSCAPPTGAGSTRRRLREHRRGHEITTLRGRESSL
ncbi:hypothetical protein GCM10010415_66420 [Streptomyces atrovirens]